MDRLEAACARDRLKPAKSKLARVIIEEWLERNEKDEGGTPETD